MVPPFEPEPNAIVHPYAITPPGRAPEHAPPIPVPEAPPGTLLDTEEITPHYCAIPNPDHHLAVRASVSLAFRHSFWKRRRDATYRVLWDLYPNKSATQAYAKCGDDAFVMQSVSKPVKYRVRSNHCHHRFCEACAKDRRFRIAQSVAQSLDGKQVRLLTLTIKSTDTPLSSQIDRILKCFAKFRIRAKIKPLLTGGIYFLEITLNPNTGQWHPHLHVICTGRYIPKDVAQSTWFAITGDSYVIDIRAIRTPKEAAGYITKYAAKALSSHVWTNRTKLREAILALAGRRTFSVFGLFRKIDLSADPLSDETWICLGSLATLIYQAQQGHVISRHIVRCVAMTGAAVASASQRSPP